MISQFSQERLLDATDPNLQTLSGELSKKWDRTRRAAQWTIVPGIFNDASSCEPIRVLQHVLSTTPPEWFFVIKACVVSRDANGAYTESWETLGADRKRQWFEHCFRQHIGKRDCCLAMDLCSYPQALEYLMPVLNGRYKYATVLFTSVCQMANRRTPQAVARVLAGVIDMSGEPDDND